MLPGRMKDAGSVLENTWDLDSHHPDLCKSMHIISHVLEKSIINLAVTIGAFKWLDAL